MASPTREGPDDEQVWQLVREFAQRCMLDERPLYTLSRGIENVIVEVDEFEIRRHSQAGSEQSAHIERHHVIEVWHELLEQGYSATRNKPRVFAHVLLQAAMPNCIEVQGNRLVLHDVPARLDPATAAAFLGYRPARGGGGEGHRHRHIRLYIFESPNDALRGLAGGPFEAVATEFMLETQDRIDVVVRDAAGCVVLIEVKPALCNDATHEQLRSERQRAFARAPWAQAAKYRTQWQVLYGTPIEQLRCVVAAPHRPERLAAAMLAAHGIECVAVELPER